MSQGKFSSLFDEGSSFGRFPPMGGCARALSAPKTLETNRSSARFKASKRSHPVRNSSEVGVIQESSLEDKLIQAKMAKSDNRKEPFKPKCTKVQLSSSHKLLGKNLVKGISIPAALFSIVMFIQIWQLCQLLTGMGATHLNEPCVYQKSSPQIHWKVDCRGSDVFVGLLAFKYFKQGVLCLMLPVTVASILWKSFSHLSLIHI